MLTTRYPKLTFHLCLRISDREASSRLARPDSQWAVAPQDELFSYYVAMLEYCIFQTMQYQDGHDSHSFFAGSSDLSFNTREHLFESRLNKTKYSW